MITIARQQDYFVIEQVLLNAYYITKICSNLYYFIMMMDTFYITVLNKKIDN